MIRITNIIGVKKTAFISRLLVKVFTHFFPLLYKKELSLKRFIIFMRRLLVFISKIKHNKFVKIGDKTRLDLYVPFFSTEAFYTACKKFMSFDKIFPCATVLVSITSTCGNKCPHCYQKRDIGKDVDINILIEVVKKLRDMGISFFNIEGGDPFLTYERLKTICKNIDNRSEIWVNTSGDGVTAERITELKKYNLTGIMFSLHSPEPEAFNKFMGREKAWDNLTSATQVCHECDVPVVFNVCLMKEDFYNGNFEKIMEKAKEFKAVMVQIIKPKPSGAWLGNEDISFSDKELEDAKLKINQYNSKKKYIEYPSISAQIIEEDKDVFGCTAGGVDRFYINAKGDVQPCEFLNISFGNISKEDFESIYLRMRNIFPWSGDCALCEYYAKDICKLYQENKLESLPLTLELSESIYNNWDRGEKTDLYKKTLG